MDVIGKDANDRVCERKLIRCENVLQEQWTESRNMNIADNSKPVVSFLYIQRTQEIKSDTNKYNYTTTSKHLKFIPLFTVPTTQ